MVPALGTSGGLLSCTLSYLWEAGIAVKGGARSRGVTHASEWAHSELAKLA